MLIYFYLSAAKTSSGDTGPQALNNSCSHYIRKFQILCLSIVREGIVIHFGWIRYL